MLFQNCRDHVVCCSIVGILRECILPRGKSKSKSKRSKNKSTTSKKEGIFVPRIFSHLLRSRARARVH